MTDPIGAIRASVAGRYEIDREIGQGAFATVYLAHDLRHDRQVAFKVLNADPNSENSEQRFLREIRLLARLQHPNILPLIDSGFAEGQLFYVMPYVSGESLRGRMQREELVPVDFAVAVARDVADALASAHEQGIIHRDIKPENILLSAGHPMIADFGIARAIDVAGVRQLTRTGSGSPGTPAYMSPEQVMGEKEIDHRSDIYSLGCVLYEMLTGHFAFSGEEGFVKRFTEPPPLPSARRRDLPRVLDDIVAKALARNPDERFATGVEFAKALNEARVTTSIPGVANRSFDGRRISKRSTILAGVGILAVVALTGWYAMARRDRLAGASQPTPAIAVLPFTNVGGDTAVEYFSDGMTDELTVALSQIPSLRVAAHTSAFSFKGSRADVRQVGEKLGVDHVLEGSVQRAGGRLRVFVQLEDARDGKAEWSDRYERDATDVFAVQDDIARSVVNVLKSRFGPSGAMAPRIQTPTNLEAHDLYLKGQFLANKGDEPNLRKALASYREALKQDPGYAPAWSGISEVYGLMSDEFLAPDASYPEAKQAAQRALALDSTVAAAWAMLGSVMVMYDRNLEAGHKALLNAFALRPDGGTAFVGLSSYYLATGQPDSAIAVLRRVEKLDPLNPFLKGWTAWFLNMVGHHDEAIAEARAALEIDPANPYAYLPIGEAMSAKGDVSAAADAYQHGMGLGNRAIAGLASAYAAEGKQAESQKLLDSLQTISHKQYVGADVIASVYAALGDRDRAFAGLERCARDRCGQLILAAWDQRWKPLRQDPRWLPFLKSTGVSAILPRD
ncbi:MAG TPA: protein kinase [Gemmatimonadaceae bacterium]